MQFALVNNPTQGPNDSIVLVPNSWDDYGFKTSFEVFFKNSNGALEEIGPVKIGYSNEKVPEMTKGSRPHWITGCKRTVDILSARFEVLPEGFFSLGQSAEYYEKVSSFGNGFPQAYFEAMRDIAFDNSILDKHREDYSLETSLLRSISTNVVLNQFSRIANGGDIRVIYDFSYDPFGSNSLTPCKMHFRVDPSSVIPDNLYAIIGLNGSGKSSLLRQFAESILNDEREESLEKINAEPASMANSRGNNLFANVSFISFSAFDDNFPNIKTTTQGSKITYHFVGLRNEMVNEEGEKHRSIADQFKEQFKSIYHNSEKTKLWNSALALLCEEASLTKANILSKFSISSEPNTCLNVFSKLSAGHKIVLLVVASLVDTVAEKSLVLLDEPETHLHPPLQSALVNAISLVLKRRNGLALIATHSPVILQNIPAKCVWKISRFNNVTTLMPFDEETFGRSITTLTRDAFGLDLENVGFRKLLKDRYEINSDFELTLAEFDGCLGDEAYYYLRVLQHTSKKD